MLAHVERDTEVVSVVCASDFENRAPLSGCATFSDRTAAGGNDRTVLIHVVRHRILAALHIRVHDLRDNPRNKVRGQRRWPRHTDWPIRSAIVLLVFETAEHAVVDFA